MPAKAETLSEVKSAVLKEIKIQDKPSLFVLEQKTQRQEGIDRLAKEGLAMLTPDQFILYRKALALAKETNGTWFRIGSAENFGRRIHILAVGEDGRAFEVKRRIPKSIKPEDVINVFITDVTVLHASVYDTVSSDALFAISSDKNDTYTGQNAPVLVGIKKSEARRLLR